MPSLNRPLACAWMTALTLLAGRGVAAPEDGMPVSGFDIQRYQGRWYEIARLENRVERGLTAVSADYSRNPDGSIRIVNRGYDPASGSWRVTVNHACFDGSPSVASLRVTLLGPLYIGYRVVALDPDYRWAVVMGPSRGYLWLLARDKRPDDSVKRAFLAKARALQSDIGGLVWVEQQRDDN
ncbi:lipocalin family protein [Chromobacterium sphagni]|uniref:Outer membrane lipoprotein Blc n=1 Tax=Chromobacterium sphagni TaxID=1903179 RepID=A0ABX3CG94_9NEIS|nr:lipocalin family protein [Chromobacterium sphagni]OHX21341.1 lipocalin [Chromobacterium sphagni]